MNVRKRTPLWIALVAICLVAQNFSPRAFAQDSTKRSIELDEIFELADQNSKAIQLALGDIALAEFKTDIAKTAKQPDINLGIEAGYLGDVSIIGFGNMPTDTYDSPNFFNNYSLEAAWVIYAGGNINRGIEISELEKKVAALNLESTREDIRLMLTGLYLNLFVMQNQREVLLKNIEQSKELLRTMSNRLKVGTILQSDYIRYELQLSSQEFALSKIDNQIHIVSNQLSETLDLDTESLLFASNSSDRAIDKATTVSDEDFARTLNVQRAGIQQQMALKNLDINKSNILPTVALFATENLSRPYIYDIPSLDIYSNVWIVGASFSFDLGKLYKNKHNVSLAEQQYRQSSTNIELTKEQTRIQLFEARVNLDEAIEHLTVSEKELELANENYTMIINQYNNQLALITDVMDASNTKLNAELQLENAKTAIQFAEYKIRHILGNL